ncbi:MAG: phage virion morphogenesis protein, partial [Candidatus Cloacimonetes bacterium]|nr:phage virion morphogenesis protein [Candidatus Cloacimonadota bacterium]
MAEPFSDLLRLIGALVVRQINQRIRSGKVTPATSKRGTTLVERGKLLRSIKYRVDGAAVVISAGGANVPYARIHHDGGIIKPKNAKYLAIPLTAQAKLYKPRQYPAKTFIAKGIIFEQPEAGGKPI